MAGATLLRGEYAGFGDGQLTTGAGTYVEIGGELFEGMVSPDYGTWESLCCGGGSVTTDDLTMYGQVRHDGHNHLFAAYAGTDGSYSVNIGETRRAPSPNHRRGCHLTILASA